MEDSGLPESQNPEEISHREDVIDPEEIQVCPRDASHSEDETGGGGQTPGCVERLRSSWQLVLIVILMVLFCTVSGVLWTQINKQQSLRAELQHMAEKVLNTTQLEKENNELKQLLNSSSQNYTHLGTEYDQLKQLVNLTLDSVTLLLVENTKLSQLLNSTLQEKTRLQVENKELNMLLNSIQENYTLVEEENTQLNVVLNESMHVISMASSENKKLQLLLQNEYQTVRQLEAKNQQQHSILFSSKLSFLWTLCNNDTLQCSRCLEGWQEHATNVLHCVTT